MRRDLPVVDEPLEHWCRIMGRVGGQPLGLDVEALLGPLDRGLRRADFGLADGARGRDIHDDAELHVDEIIVA